MFDMLFVMASIFSKNNQLKIKVPYEKPTGES